MVDYDIHSYVEYIQNSQILLELPSLGRCGFWTCGITRVSFPNLDVLGGYGMLREQTFSGGKFFILLKRCFNS